jgi:hypothetical protein
MQRFVKLALGLAAASVIGASNAQAATWLLNYTATNGAAPTEATLTLQTSDTLNTVGGYDVSGVSGDVDGDTVTGLIDNPAQPFVSYSGDGMFIFDNVLYASTAPLLSNPGLFFAAASGDEYNLFSDSSTVYELYQAKSGVGYLDHSVGELSAQQLPEVRGVQGLDLQGGAIPEPAAWTLMILGFGGAGAVLRRRRTASAATAS